MKKALKHGKNVSTSKVLAAGGVVLLFLLLPGCNQNNSTPGTTTTPTVTANDTNNVDNSKINERDRGDMTLTPGDQGASDADRQITRKVRQKVVSSTNDYSVIAKNVKIITADGKVTLRGPVNTLAEKTGIEAIAKNVAGEGNVDDQLEVKTNP